MEDIKNVDISVTQPKAKGNVFKGWCLADGTNFDFETVMNEFEKTISILKNNYMLPLPLLYF